MSEEAKIEAGTLLVSSSPHAHAPGSVRSIMRDVIIALVPALLASWWFFGAKALILECTCVASCVLAEWLCRRAMGRPDTTADLSAVVTGLLLAFNLPPGISPLLAAVGGIFAIVVCKQFYGGLGYNPFNPALAARAFLLLSFTGAMTTWSASGWVSVADVLTTATPISPDAMTTATPLGFAKGGLKAGAAALGMTPALGWRLFLGDVNGCIGETSALALLLGGAYLLARKVIPWQTPLAFIGTVAVGATIIHAVSPATQMPASFHLLTGGLLLGAIFMATDMVTSPTTGRGQLIFGFCCGVLTLVIRTVASGDYPEGVSFSILIMNAFVPLINRFTRKIPFGESHA